MQPQQHDPDSYPLETTVTNERTPEGPSPSCPWCGVYTRIYEDLAEPGESTAFPRPDQLLVCGDCGGTNVLELRLRPATHREVESGGEELAATRRRVIDSKKENS